MGRDIKVGDVVKTVYGKLEIKKVTRHNQDRGQLYIMTQPTDAKCTSELGINDKVKTKYGIASVTDIEVDPDMSWISAMLVTN